MKSIHIFALIVGIAGFGLRHLLLGYEKVHCVDAYIKMEMIHGVELGTPFKLGCLSNVSIIMDSLGAVGGEDNDECFSSAIVSGEDACKYNIPIDADVAATAIGLPSGVLGPTNALYHLRSSGDSTRAMYQHGVSLVVALNGTSTVLMCEMAAAMENPVVMQNIGGVTAPGYIFAPDAEPCAQVRAWKVSVGEALVLPPWTVYRVASMEQADTVEEGGVRIAVLSTADTSSAYYNVPYPSYYSDTLRVASTAKLLQSTAGPGGVEATVRAVGARLQHHSKAAGATISPETQALLGNLGPRCSEGVALIAARLPEYKDCMPPAWLPKRAAGTAFADLVATDYAEYLLRNWVGLKTEADVAVVAECLATE